MSLRSMRRCSHLTRASSGRKEEHRIWSVKDIMRNLPVSHGSCSELCDRYKGLYG